MRGEQIGQGTREERRETRVRGEWILEGSNLRLRVGSRSARNWRGRAKRG